MPIEIENVKTESPSNRRTRAGYTLVDLIAIMTISSIVVSVVAVALQTFYRVHTDARDDIHIARSLTPLGNDFRWDVRNGNAIATIPAGTLEFGEQTIDHHGALSIDVVDGRRIVYAIDGDSVRRLQFDEGELFRHEAYLFPDDVEISLLLEEWKNRPLAILKLSRPTDRPRPGQQAFDVNIEASASNINQNRGATIE